MPDIFPEPIRNLPEADIPLQGLRAYLSQAQNHQILFMQFEQDAELPEHRHAAQVGIVLKGRIDLTIDGTHQIFGQGDIYFIPAGVPHAAQVHAGYADITFFDEANRYTALKS